MNKTAAPFNCSFTFLVIALATTVSSLVDEGTVRQIKVQQQKHFQNVMLVGMASEISKRYTYKCVDRSRHNGIKGAMTKCVL